MTRRAVRLLPLGLAALLFLAATARADGGLSVTYSKHGRQDGLRIEAWAGRRAAVARPSYRRGPQQYPRCEAPRRVWIPAHYETVRERAWVPGCTERIWVEPVHQTRCDRWGRSYTVMVRGGYWETVQHPGHFEWVERQVLQPAHWELR